MAGGILIYEQSAAQLDLAQHRRFPVFLVVDFVCYIRFHAVYGIGD
jgi:hypothetical protein